MTAVPYDRASEWMEVHGDTHPQYTYFNSLKKISTVNPSNVLPFNYLHQIHLPMTNELTTNDVVLYFVVLALSVGGSVDMAVFVVNGAEAPAAPAARVAKTQEQGIDNEPGPSVLASANSSEDNPSFRDARRLEARLPCSLPRIYVGSWTSCTYRCRGAVYCNDFLYLSLLTYFCLSLLICSMYLTTLILILSAFLLRTYHSQGA